MEGDRRRRRRRLISEEDSLLPTSGEGQAADSKGFSPMKLPGGW